MKIRYNLAFSLLLFLISPFTLLGRSDSIYLKVRILTDKNIKQLSINTIRGNYKIVGTKTKTYDLESKTTLLVSMHENKIRIKKSGVMLGNFDTVKIISCGKDGILKLTTGKLSRKYDDDLIIYVAQGNIRLINRVELEHYTSGVVLSEGGDAKNLEFFKLQCLISRTYALKNIRKHEQEAYQLCDQVHCQLYFGHTSKSEILDANLSTCGLVILGPDTQLISAAFHSNSGGETTNSESVWSLPAPYLQATEDTFSLSMPMARWERKIPKKEWISTLQTKYHFPVNNKVMLDSALTFTQDHRKVNYVGGIPLKDLRNDFKLRSTFFNIEDQGEILLIKGRGYGHGVGLSQEGAIRMARDGYSFNDILKYYYKNIIISTVDTSMLPRKK